MYIYEGWQTRTNRASRNMINCHLERLVRKTISTRARRSQRYLRCDHITNETETMAAKSVPYLQTCAFSTILCFETSIKGFGDIVIFSNQDNHHQQYIVFKTMPTMKQLQMMKPDCSEQLPRTLAWY